MLVRRDVDAYFVIIITEVLWVVANFVKLHSAIHISIIDNFILVVDEEHIVLVARMTKDASEVELSIVLSIVKQFRVVEN